MPFVFGDRVKDTTTSPGTGQVTLANSAPTGYQTFGSVCADGDTFHYVIADQFGVNWEVGLGSYTASGTKLNRLAVLASSNAGAATNFAAGTQDVFMTFPAASSAGRESSRTVPRIATDFLGLASQGGTPSEPWGATLWGSATFSDGVLTASHPGTIRVTSSSTNPSGGVVCFGGNNAVKVILGGGESGEFIFQPVTLTNQTLRLGWFRSSAGAVPSDGLWLEMASSGALTLNAAQSSTSSASASLGTLTTNTWYRVTIDLAYNAASAVGILYNASGSILGSQTISTNIPTTNSTAFGVQTNNAGTNVGALVDVDWMMCAWNKPLSR